MTQYHEDSNGEEDCEATYGCISVLILYGIVLGVLSTVIYFVYGR